MVKETALINPYSIIIFISIIAVSSFGLMVKMGGQSESSKGFALCTLWLSLWGASLATMLAVIDPNVAIIFLRFTYLFGIIEAIFFYFFTINFPSETKIDNKIIIVCSILILILSYIFIGSNLIVESIFKIDSISSWGWKMGNMSYIFYIVFFGIFTISLHKLIKSYQSIPSQIMKRNVLTIIISTIFGLVPPVVLSIILPAFGIFTFNWVSPLFQILWLPIVIYSISKGRLFTTRIFLIEFSIFVMWMAVSIRSFYIINWHEFVLEISLLSVSVAFGILLIHSYINNDILTKQINDLKSELEKAYSNTKVLPGDDNA